MSTNPDLADYIICGNCGAEFYYETAPTHCEECGFPLKEPVS